MTSAISTRKCPYKWNNVWLLITSCIASYILRSNIIYHFSFLFTMLFRDHLISLFLCWEIIVPSAKFTHQKYAIKLPKKVQNKSFCFNWFVIFVLGHIHGYPQPNEARCCWLDTFLPNSYVDLKNVYLVSIYISP